MSTINNNIPLNEVASTEIEAGYSGSTTTVTQEKHPQLIPFNNLYINGNRIN